MAIGTTYTLDDPIPDSSFPLFAMDGAVSYGYQEGGAASMQPAVPPPFSSRDEDKSELRTEYNSNPMLGVTFKRQPYTTSQRKNSVQDPLLFDNFTGNSDVSKQSSTGLALKSHSDQFDELAKFFGFNKTEWADIFSVSRQTIYGWLKNELKPSGENASKISWLYGLLVAIPNRQERDRLFRGYIYHHISVCNCSLLEVFKSGMPSGYEMSDLVEVVSSLLKLSQKKAKELDELEKTGLASEATLDHNLDDLLNCLE